jgi:hypothetical protein
MSNAVSWCKRRSFWAVTRFSVPIFGVCFAASVSAEVVDQETQNTQTAHSSSAVLPSLSTLLPPDSPLRLRFPDVYDPDEPRPPYARRLPLGAQAAIDRGAILPRPWGFSLSYIDNSQGQNIEDLSVALGKGAAPPVGTDLVDLPFVRIENAQSNTRTGQVRADVWVLPFLNVFGGIGKVEGRVPLDVVVDLNETELCPPIVTCDSVRASFDAGVEANTATIGMTGAYGWDNWFVSGSASLTDSFGGNTVDAVRSVSVSGRIGRRWAFGPGHIVSPFVGVSYLDINQVVEGTTRLPDAFPDGEELAVRYKARISNKDKWSGVIGLNLGYVQGVSIAGEYNYSPRSKRFLLSSTFRY